MIGNHDDFLRTHNFVAELLRHAGIDIAENFTHVTSNHRRFLVTHGDSFDTYESRSALFKQIATMAYNGLLRANHFCRCRLGWRPAVVSIRAKFTMTSLAGHIRSFRDALTRHAASQGYSGVICGHIHAPERSTLNGIEYCNTGDWVESCSAIIEDTHGNLRLEFCGR